MEKSFTYSELEVQEIIRETVKSVVPTFSKILQHSLANEAYEKFRKKEEKVFYRVCNENTLRGLWYDYNGNFTGIIHEDFNFCKHKDLQMEYDPELVGWLSATDTLDKLFEWFPPSDILRLQQEGWFLHKFVASDFKFYDRFQHLVIKQETSKSIEKLILRDIKELPMLDFSEVGTYKDGELEVVII